MNSSRASSSSSYEWDVFLSFRGPDTGKTFTGNLHKALLEKNVKTFMADTNLTPGKIIDATLNKKIQESRIAIVVFSENYASSRFCLEELETIMECLRYEGMLVWPIFYGVDPSDVRYQKGSYGEGLAKHEARYDDERKIGRWRTALKDAANLSGFSFKPNSNEFEHEFIDKITQHIINSLRDVEKNQIAESIPTISNMKPSTQSGNNRRPYFIRTSDGQLHHMNCPAQQPKQQSSRSKNKGGENLPDKRVDNNKSLSFSSEVIGNIGGGGYFQGAYPQQCVDCTMNQEMAVWNNITQQMMHGQPPNMAVNYMSHPFYTSPFPPPGP